MTLLEERPLLPEVVPDAEATPVAAEPPPPATGAESLVRAVIVLLIAAIVAVALWKAFDQLVAPTWYRNRQHHLAADYAQQRPGLEAGQAAGVLQIPGVGANLIVVEGSAPSQLRGGPGHRSGTPMLGEKGNSLIEGHRARWGGPLGQLPKLVKRTRIVAMGRSGIPVEYRVTLVKKVVKRDQLARYLAPSPDVRLTIVTSAGGAGSDDRLVIQAVSGVVSKQAGKGQAPPLDPPAGSPAGPMLLALLALAAAGAAWFRLRRDHGLLSVILVVVPLLSGAVLALLLAADSVLSPLL